VNYKGELEQARQELDEEEEEEKEAEDNNNNNTVKTKTRKEKEKDLSKRPGRFNHADGRYARKKKRGRTRN
jgi:hypothetical protein